MATTKSQEENVGTHIRGIRLRRQLSLTELSRRVGVSKSMISQIERGTSNPSLTVLRAIARELDVPLFTLFVEKDLGSALVRRADRRQLHVPGSDIVRELLVPDLHRRMILLSARFEPGDESSGEPSIHQGEECLIVLSGAIEIEFNTTKVELGAGDSYYFDSEVPHIFRNVGTEPAEIIAAICPD